MIFTSLSPNTEKDDIALARSLLFKPGLWQEGGAGRDLEFTFREWLPARYALNFDSGRTCLYAILKALGVKKRDEVLLQAYTCAAVPDPIIWAGAKPVYVDCQEDFTMSSADLKKKISPKSKALIIQHTFGKPADLKVILAIAKRHKLFVIEDCAHCLGGKHNGKHLGTFGDASFFSFGRDKVISSISGGILATNNQALAGKLEKFQKALSYPSRFWVAKNLWHPLIFVWGKKSYNFCNIGKIFLFLVKELGIIPRAVYPAEKQGEKPPMAFRKMPNALTVLALRQLNKLERFNHHRREIAAIYDKELKDLPGVKLPQQAPGHSYLRYTIRVADPQILIDKAKTQGIELGNWYNRPVAPQDVNQQKVFYKPGSCPVAEWLAKESVNLPTNIQTSPVDALRVAQFIKQTLHSTAM